MHSNFLGFQGSQAAMKNLTSKVAKMDTESLKQQEIVYNQVCSHCFFLNNVQIALL